MKRPSLLDWIRVVLARFGLSYLNVDHKSMLWKRKGQFLIVLQTFLMVTSWMNFASYIFKDYDSFFPTMQANLAYWTVTLLQLAFMIVPIWVAQRGRVQTAAHLMLITSIFGLIKYAIARDFPEYNLLMMASMFLMIPLAGTLLRPRASFFIAILISALEVALSSLLDPNINPMILPNIIWMNLNFGAVMSMILVIYELTVKDAASGEPMEAGPVTPLRPEDLEWVGWTVARNTLEQVSQPIEDLRIRLIDFEQAQAKHLNYEARAEIDDIQASLKHLHKELARITAVNPAGMMEIELERRDLRASWVLDAMGNDNTEGGSPRVIVQRDPTAPEQVYVAPVALRLAIDDIIKVVIKETGTQEVTIIDSSTDNFWLIRILSGKALPFLPTHHIHPNDPALRRAIARIEAMPGTLSIEAAPGSPVVMTVSIRLES